MGKGSRLQFVLLLFNLIMFVF